MTKTTILEKFNIILETTKSSKIFFAVIAFIILLAIVALTTNKKNANKSKKIYITVYIIAIISFIAVYHNSLGKMFDYMMNNLFVVIYFPNIAVYMAAIIISNIIMWTSTFNVKVPKLLRAINVTIYGIIHYLLALVLNVISKKQLDVFSQTSLYGNKEVQAIIEISSIIFMTWIVFLIIYKIIRHFQTPNEEIVPEKIVVKKVRALPKNIIEVQPPIYVKAPPKKEVIAKQNEETLAIQLMEQVKVEKEILEQKLADAENKLLFTQQQLNDKQNEITTTAKEQDRFYQEKLNFEQSYTQLFESQQRMIKQEQDKLRIEKEQLQKEQNSLEVERKKLEEAQALAKLESKKASTTAETIMQNLDGVFTLEDYKFLSTILKEQQKRKKAAAKKEEEKRQKEELIKFNQLREAYKNAR